MNQIQVDLAKSPAEKASAIPVSELCRLFLEERGNTDLRLASQQNYQQLFEFDLLPVCGDMPLSMVDRSALQRVIQHMIDRGLAASTIHSKSGLLTGLFSWGVEDGHLPASPCDSSKRLRLPECSSKSTGKMLSAAEACKLLATLDGTAYWLPTYLALHTGMRPGEVLGLSWEDVDLVAGTLSVRRTMSREKGGFRLGPPKTNSSERLVAVSADVVAVLRSWEQSRPEVVWYPGATIVPEGFRQVCSRENGAIFTGNAWRWGLDSGLRRADLQHFRLHDLRHTHASLLLLDRVPMHVVSARLGHANIQVTINLYGHLLPTSDPEAAASFAAILRAA